MKKFFLLLLLAALPSFADPAQTMSGTLTVAASDCLSGAAHSCVSMGLSSGAGAATVQVSGTYTGTLQFEMTNDPNGCAAAASTFVNVSASPLPSGTAVSSTTSTGTWRVNAAGGTCLHVRASALASGTAVVAMSYGTGSASAGAGGGAPVSFDAIVGGTNTGAAMVVGTGASLAASGSGTIAATSLAGLTGTLHQIPVGSAGALADSAGLSETYPTFTVNESQAVNGTQSVIGDIKTTQLTAPSTLACVQGAATGGFLLHNQAYFYKVTAISANGETTVSNESTFTTAASPVGDTYTASCTWTGHTGDTGYKLYRATTTGNELLLATITPGNVNSYTDNTNTTPSGAMPTVNSTASLGVGTATPAGKLSVTSLDLNGGGAPSLWGTGWSLFGPGANSTTGSAVAIGYDLSNQIGYLITLQPGTAWRPFVLDAGTVSILSANGTSASVLGVGKVPALATLDVAGGGAFTGPMTFTPAARTSGVASYFTLTIPTDTGQTASTESIGYQHATGTRTWATTGTVALQRENFFAGPTYASASASQTFTDVFNSYFTPPVQGTNAIFTRNHTLGIVDATSAASSITGGLVVATTLGTTATSVGIGGGNVNAGGTVTGATGTFTTLSAPTTYGTLGVVGNGLGSVQAAPTAVTIGSGANIAATSLCSTTLCPAGDYDVAVYIEITTACTTTGTYIPWLGWTDDQGAKAGSSTTTYFSGGGLGVTPATASTGATLGLASLSNFLTGHMYLHTTGAATGGAGSINYGATATACGTGGPMIGKMYFTVTRLR